MNSSLSVSILGSGWLGFPLAQSLQNKDKLIRLSTRSSEKAHELTATYIKPYLIDIEKKSIQLEVFLQSETLIINITSKDFEAFKKLITEIEKSPIKHVLFISSTSVYANHLGVCKESDQIVVENNLRQIEKLFIDNMHFDCTIIRFAGLIGPKRHPGRFFATGKVIKDANAKVNLIHQVDCIELIKTVLTQGAWGEVFNGCADSHPTKKEYYSIMAASLCQPKPKYLIAEQSACKTICNEKIKEQLGFQFIYPDLYDIDWS